MSKQKAKNKQTEVFIWEERGQSFSITWRNQQSGYKWWQKPISNTVLIADDEQVCLPRTFWDHSHHSKTYSSFHPHPQLPKPPHSHLTKARSGDMLIISWKEPVEMDRASNTGRRPQGRLRMHWRDYLGWSGNARTCLRRWSERGKSELLCLGCCSRNPGKSGRKWMDSWLDGWNFMYQWLLFKSYKLEHFILKNCTSWRQVPSQKNKHDAR